MNMKQAGKSPPAHRWRNPIRLVGIVLCGLLLHITVSAQQQPPRPINIYVSPVQNLNFGAFFQGAAGGSIIVYPNGTRSSTGTVIPANFGFTYSPALFEVDAEPGTIITILNGPAVTLNGSNGGSMQLTLGTSSPGSPFVGTALSPARNAVSVGGTLTVGNNMSSPAGDYSGSFTVIFFQQ